MKDLITPPVPPPRPKVEAVLDEQNSSERTGKVLVDGVEMASWKTGDSRLCGLVGELAIAFYGCRLESRTELASKAKGKPFWSI